LPFDIDFISAVFVSHLPTSLVSL